MQVETAAPIDAPAAVVPVATPNPLLALCTRKQQAFILNLLADPQGNQTRAYEAAGFKARGDSAAANAAKCLRNDRVRAAFDSLRNAALAGEESKAIATATERREMLTKVMRDREMHPIARLKAVDIHNKMDGEYVERHEVEHRVPGSVVFIITRQPGAENRT